MSTRSRGRHGHKDRQVCRQVADAVAWYLAETDDPLLADLIVIQVDPAPSAARVLVTLAAAHGEIDAVEVMSHLREVADELREEVAVEVHRRHAPELSFRVIPVIATATE
ncbi:MAG: ribosome-binding factor A [Kofleriaceae bacterium]|nr:MAG: ribosome-binding factor A [Kofleriaceae bacterium]MBZ0238098.1 ribosome-binding factor A [Kofleriaceae bacterium]